TQTPLYGAHGVTRPTLRFMESLDDTSIPHRDQEPDRDRSPVAAASHSRKAMDFPMPLTARTCCGRGPSAVRFLESGFTLLELVISSALMAGILASAYLCLRSGLSSQKLIESRADILQNARVAMALLTADLRGACPLAKQFEFLGMDRMLGEVEADNIDFATHNYTPRREREGDFCEISYFLEKDRQSEEFSLWRRRDATPDDDPLSGGSREEIARGLRGLKFEYYDGFDWFDEWGDAEGRRKGQVSLIDHPNLAGLPEAVRITASFDPNPHSKKATGPETKSEEPPLVFQTVAHLNLAAVSLGSSSSGSSSDAGNSGATQPAQAGPDGGGR
ncbi:MAG: prepilin-type N-terminal cleavage/methylation domain-containing protein, partial [Verrucomicrobiales bacterium]|nr:prepilin-type N-terminal cleavage/methylation domain-containing protein [Verrucomicrobiales bacterium]